MRIALINGEGLVVNAILVEGEYLPPDGLTCVELDDESPVGPLWRWIDEAWVEPDPVDPGLPPPSTDDLIVQLQSSIEYLQEQIDILLLESLG
jgi:hypothetical protein